MRPSFVCTFDAWVTQSVVISPFCRVALAACGCLLVTFPPSPCCSRVHHTSLVSFCRFPSTLSFLPLVPYLRTPKSARNIRNAKVSLALFVFVFFVLAGPDRPLMAFPEDDILTYAGFDAAIFLRFYAVAFKVRDNLSPSLLSSDVI